MVESILRGGRVYTLLFRTKASYQNESSLYYLHKETGMGYRVRYDRREFHEVFLGMRTFDDPPVIGGFETIKYIKEHDGVFPSFLPKLGLNLLEPFDIERRLIYPCGLVMWDNHSFVLSDVVKGLGKERIVLKETISPHLQFHYSHALVEMYDTYDPFDYLQS